ncbi:MAG: hypothetical protein HY741_00895 [Chloroflexi bacterium]|nr:hypothetical protein [Chloroflexota bacterium]
MGEVVTLNLPEVVAARARTVAAQRHRRIEDVLLEWLEREAVEPPVETLSDADVLALCDSQLTALQQSELDDLLFDQREGQLTEPSRKRLEELMEIYRRGLLRKAQALRVAVRRGLRPPLG